MTVTGSLATPESIEARRVSFLSVAHGYDRVRAGWRPDTLSWMLGAPHDGVRLRVLDLGAGTGKATRTLAQMGHDVVAVDPSDAMLGALRDSAAGLDPEAAARVTTRVGSAEAIPVGAAAVDAVTVLQAWHWFDEDAAAAECARVLRPGGWLAMAWHTWDPDPRHEVWLAELADLVGHPETATPATDGLSPPSADFGAGERRTVTFDHVLGPGGLRTLAASWSFVQVRPDRETVLDRVAELGERVAGEQRAAGRDDGSLAFPQVSVCYRYRRR